MLIAADFAACSYCLQLAVDTTIAAANYIDVVIVTLCIASNKEQNEL